LNLSVVCPAAHLVLTAGASVVPGLANQLVRVLELAKRAFPGAEAALAAAAASPMGGSAADSGLAGGTGGGAFPEAIELEANSYFQKLYHERQPVDELVQQLKAFKTGTAHQQVVFACMVHNLFDEYRFFPNYPDLELDTTAALFGALLHHQLLTNITLGMALRHVLQALAQPPNSKMFRFGLGAIRQFQPELSLWPKFCERALAIPHLKGADSAIVALMEKVVGSSSVSSSSGADVGDLTGPAGPAAGAGAAAGAASSVPNGINTASSTSGGGGGGGNSSSAGGSNPKAADPPQQQPAQQQQQQGGGRGGAAAGRGPAGRDNAQNGPAAQSGGQGQGGKGGAAGGKGGATTSHGSMDTADNLRDMMNNANVAQAAATMALNDKPERMTLNMTLNNETLDTAERKRSEALAPNEALTDKVGNRDMGGRRGSL
jgi:CCR4-NOT transcription complex subunit 1